MDNVARAVVMALAEAFNMAWEVLWPLILGFALSAAVQAVVSKKSMELLFAALGIVPTQRDIAVFTEGPSLNYTTLLNIAFLVLAAVLVWRFLRTGGPAMLRMMAGGGH